jgi:PAS domain-containing protein
MKTANIEDIYRFVTNESLANDIAVAFDRNLHYISLNQNACRLLQKDEHELIGKCMTDLFPSVIASRNHRNMLKAATGIRIQNDVVESVTGSRFIVSYEPFLIDRQVQAIFVRAKPVDAYSTEGLKDGSSALS